MFPIETIYRNAMKVGKPGEKPGRKSYHPYGFRNLYKTINQ
jgi:hypothetical protein